MEVTQFTYFQQVGGIDCDPVPVELTYGMERLAMYVQGVDNVYDLDWDGHGTRYGDVFLRAEREFSAFNFEHADVERLRSHFNDAEAECTALLATDPPLSLPAYDQCMKASHLFNLLDARGAIQRGGTRGLHRPRPRAGQGLLRGLAGGVGIRHA